MPTSLELRKQRDAKIQEMHDLTSKTSFPEEQQKRWKELEKEEIALGQQIEMVERSETLSAEMRKHTPPPAGQPDGSDNRGSDKDEEKRNKAFDLYCRRGLQAVENDAELRSYVALDTETTGDAAGVTIPIGFQRELEIKKKAFGGVSAVARELPTSIGNTINWPKMDDTNNEGEYLTENAPVSQKNPQFGNIQLFSNLLSSKQALISVQLMNDSAFDMQAELGDAFAIRLGRAENRKFTFGNGSGEPQGFIPALLAADVLTGDIVVDAVGDIQTGNTAANSVGVDDLDNVQMQVNAAYRNNPTSGYMFSDNILSHLKKLKDSFGRPLWVASLTQAQPDTIYGKKFTVNYSMDSLPATSSPAYSPVSVAYGDWSKYIIRRVGGVTVVRYNELYMPNHQIGFQAFERNDGRLIQPAAFALLQHSA